MPGVNKSLTPSHCQLSLTCQLSFDPGIGDDRKQNVINYIYAQLPWLVVFFQRVVFQPCYEELARGGAHVPPQVLRQHGGASGARLLVGRLRRTPANGLRREV